MNSPNISATHVTRPTEPTSTSNSVLPLPYPGCAPVPALREKTRYLRLKRVKARTGLSKSSIYAKQKRGEFPMRVQITAAAVGWVEEQVEAWCKERERCSTPLPLKPSEPKPTA